MHDIDIARFLLDDEPAAISVETPRKNSRGNGLADPLLTLIEMRSGALVSIETSVNIAYAYDIRGEVIGETGVVTLAERNHVVVKANGTFFGRVPADWRERFIEAFDTEFRAWIAAAEAGGATGPRRGMAMSRPSPARPALRRWPTARAKSSPCANVRPSMGKA